MIKRTARKIAKVLGILLLALLVFGIAGGAATYAAGGSKAVSRVYSLFGKGKPGDASHKAFSQLEEAYKNGDTKGAQESLSAFYESASAAVEDNPSQGKLAEEMSTASRLYGKTLRKLADKLDPGVEAREMVASQAATTMSRTDLNSMLTVLQDAVDPSGNKGVVFLHDKNGVLGVPVDLARDVMPPKDWVPNITTPRPQLSAITSPYVAASSITARADRWGGRTKYIQRLNWLDRQAKTNQGRPLNEIEKTDLAQYRREYSENFSTSAPRS
ncbi:MAG: hypothetical protein HY336_00380 [Candidatus Doudnabacteria bacterium]|nr:hypothetical protein [Candidatus Doudnabacteria bacterium]